MRWSRILMSLMLLISIKCARDSSYEQSPMPEDPEEHMDIVEVIRYHGYPVEVYDIVTEDGYVLTVQRIPYGKNSKNVSNEREVVLLLHGIVSSSSCWVANTPDKNLPYLLAEKGYDVWLGNIRGCTHGLRHRTLSTDEENFWKFSFQEMAKYDLPAMIEFIFAKTGSNQLHYIGHSMGTTIVFCLLSTNTTYNEKIRSVHALAPVTKMDHFRNPAYYYLVQFVDEVSHLLKLITGGKFMLKSPIVTDLCKYKNARELCTFFIFCTNGFDREQFNMTRLPVYLNLYVDGSSVQTFQHFGQIAYHHRFQAFDYGKEKNKEIYNQTIPPLYDMEKITVPVALYWAENDLIADPRDVKVLSETLHKTLVLNYRVPYDSFNHMDMLLAKDVVPLLHEKILETLEKY